MRSCVNQRPRSYFWSDRLPEGCRFAMPTLKSRTSPRSFDLSRTALDRSACAFDTIALRDCPTLSRAERPGRSTPSRKSDAHLARPLADESRAALTALSGKPPAGSEGFGVGCWHGSDLLSPASFCAGRHPARCVALSMDGPRMARALQWSDNQSVAAIYPAFDAACAAGLDEVRGSVPNYLGGHLQPDRANGFGRSRSDRLSSQLCSPSHCRD
jgi:hypothetical protein